MSKLVIVNGDAVSGNCTHKVSGSTSSAPPVAYSGTGQFDYNGKMSDKLSDFVKIGGKTVAIKDSQSSLNPGESVSPAGKHSGPQGSAWKPPSPAPNTTTLSITDPIGTGTPNSKAGSEFVTIHSVPLLLDADKIDTCGGTGGTANSSVTAKGQDFVTCSE